MQKFYKDGIKILEVMYKEGLFSDSAIFKTLEEIGELANLNTSDTDAAVDYLTSSDYIQRDALGSNPNLTLTNYGTVHIETYLNIGVNDLENEVSEEIEMIKPNPRNVFVVHGRNLEIMDSMFAFLQSIDLRPIEWSVARAKTKKTNPYIGEILDIAFRDAQAIIIIMDPEDVVYLHEKYIKDDDKDDEREPQLQSRPNVLFEAGLAMGRDENRTILVEIGNPKSFSDIAGRHTMRINNTVSSRQEFAQRLQTAGCKIDIKGINWHKAGDFSIEELTIENIQKDSSGDSSERILPNEEIEILKLLAVESLNAGNIQQMLEKSKLKIDYVIDKLLKENFVREGLPYFSIANNELIPIEITAKGRAYLIENNILE